MPCYVHVTEELARGWMSLAGAMGGHLQSIWTVAARSEEPGPLRHTTIWAGSVSDSETEPARD